MHSMSGKLGAIITADRWTMAPEQLGQNGKNTVAFQLTLNIDRQALSRVFVDRREHAEGLPVVRALHDGFEAERRRESEARPTHSPTHDQCIADLAARTIRR